MMPTGPRSRRWVGLCICAAGLAILMAQAGARLTT